MLDSVFDVHVVNYAIIILKYVTASSFLYEETETKDLTRIGIRKQLGVWVTSELWKVDGDCASD